MTRFFPPVSGYDRFFYFCINSQVAPNSFHLNLSLPKAKAFNMLVLFATLFALSAFAAEARSVKMMDVSPF